jgi:hypothetical protein
VPEDKALATSKAGGRRVTPPDLRVLGRGQFDPRAFGGRRGVVRTQRGLPGSDSDVGAVAPLRPPKDTLNQAGSQRELADQGLGDEWPVSVCHKTSTEHT